jgi:hypothetical protein
LAGEALECALKAKVMRTQSLNSRPSRISRPDLYTLDPNALMKEAGLEPALLAEIAAATSAGAVGDFPLYALRLYRAKRSVSARPRKFDMKVRRLLAA